MPRTGVTALPEYPVWAAMIQRCTNPRDKGFKRYGARGIQVCNSWRVSFKSFLEDMGKRPSDLHSLERVDNNGNYCPDNCVWGTRTQQNRNRRNCVHLTVGNRTQLMTDWARERDIPESVIHKRLKRGWDVFRAVMTPAARTFAAAHASSSRASSRSI